MTQAEQRRGGTPVGVIADLDGVEAASVIYLRLWCDGPASQAVVWKDFATALGTSHGRKALEGFDQLCGLCCQHGRRPLTRHGVNCKCLGADESCFANFIATAAEGAREDAMLIATLLVRVDVAPIVTALATDFGLALKRMYLRAPRDVASFPTHETTLH
ncbi:MAG: hypothetical protein P1U83_10795 [Roseovarius sp.]|nr:hypothetical protein [Roseovarius sp.]